MTKLIDINTYVNEETCEQFIGFTIDNLLLDMELKVVIYFEKIVSYGTTKEEFLNLFKKRWYDSFTIKLHIKEENNAYHICKEVNYIYYELGWKVPKSWNTIKKQRKNLKGKKIIDCIMSDINEYGVTSLNFKNIDTINMEDIDQNLGFYESQLVYDKAILKNYQPSL